MARNEKAQMAAANTNRLPAEEEIDDLPPAYSMPSPSSSTVERPLTLGRTVPGLPNINFASYAPPGATASKCLSTINIIDSTACKSPQALAKLISDQIALPPVPEIHIRGSHKVWGLDEEDFNIRLNMTQYFLPRAGETGLSYSKLVSAGGKRKSPLPESGASAIEVWAQAFCSDPAADKW